jgi:hypothetical protein
VSADGDRAAATAPPQRSYYGRPVIKEPVWKPEIPFYFYAGGLAGASAGLAFLAGLRGNDELARRAWAGAVAGVTASPALLVSDLGYRTRFLNMLRLFKVTSPMSVGSWNLTASGLCTTLAAVHAWTGLFPAAGRIAKPAAAALGLPLSTYTAALIANTAVPVWHEARWTLPFLFASGAAASAGAAAVAVTPPKHAAAARRVALGGAAAEVGASLVMERRLGDLGEPYHEGAAGLLSRVARALTVAGAGVVAGAGSRRAGAIAGGALLTAGAVCERWSVFRAGFQSAADPRFTVGPQRERIARGRTRGGARAISRQPLGSGT